MLWRVTQLPLLFHFPLLAAGLLCFINGAGEYVATSMRLVDGSTRPVSVRIDEYFRGAYPGQAYALAGILMAICAAVLAATRLFSRRD